MTTPLRRAAELAAATIMTTPGGARSREVQRRAVEEAAALCGDGPAFVEDVAAETKRVLDEIGDMADAITGPVLSRPQSDGRRRH